MLKDIYQNYLTTIVGQYLKGFLILVTNRKNRTIYPNEAVGYALANDFTTDMKAVRKKLCLGESKWGA